MSKGRDPEVYLKDILESINLIERFLDGISEAEFYKNIEKQDAVLRRLEIIGEAVKKLPKDITEAHEDIPWRQIAGMRDVIIHAYFGITLSMVWKVVKENLPDLKKRVEKLLEERGAKGL